MPALNATPLLSLDAVVIDTETTGLDPRSARILDAAGVRLRSGQIMRSDVYSRHVNPGVVIPPASQAVHGITQEMIKDAADFPQVWEEFSCFAGSDVVIGHTLGFDLAVLKAECARATLPWKKPRVLDTRLLAQIARPDLAGFSLEKLSVWLNISITDRHSALGDALLTAEIFKALVPILREGGIRTLAEAEAACLSLVTVLEGHHQAGWEEAVTTPARENSVFRKLDSFPYVTTLSSVMSQPLVISPELSLSQALNVLMDRKVSSVFVSSAAVPDHFTAGILTERDILRALHKLGSNVLLKPAGDFASFPVHSVQEDAFLYRAIGRMSRLKLRHLAVCDALGRIVGAVSARDLLKLRAGEAYSLGDEIDTAQDASQLAAAWSKLPEIAGGLLAESVCARDVARVISRELGALTRRAGVLAERAMQETGLGAAPCPYALLVLGSAGRGESLLALDQDNALIFSDEKHDGWFAGYGIHLADILHQAGVPYCKGGVMVKTPLWRGTPDLWKTRVQDWVRRASPDDLLNVDIFYDLRCVHGDVVLARQIADFASEAAKGQTAFAKLLAASLGDVSPPVTLIGGFKTDERGRIDLKKHGLFPLVTTARVFALRHGIHERSTLARMLAVKSLDLGGAQDIDRLLDAHMLFLDLILRQQLTDIASGVVPSARIDVSAIDAGSKKMLKAAFQDVKIVNDLLRNLLF